MMLRPNLTPSTTTEGRAILLWNLRDAPAALLDDVFEHDAEMRDRFLKDWSGADVLVAVAWEMCARSRALRLMENLLTRLTENGEQDVHWYALRPARVRDSLYAVFYANFDTAITPEVFTHADGCLCAFCCRERKRYDASDSSEICLASAAIM